MQDACFSRSAWAFSQIKTGSVGKITVRNYTSGGSIGDAGNTFLDVDSHGWLWRASDANYVATPEGAEAGFWLRPSPHLLWRTDPARDAGWPVLSGRLAGGAGGAKAVGRTVADQPLRAAERQQNHWIRDAKVTAVTDSGAMTGASAGLQNVGPQPRAPAGALIRFDDIKVDTGVYAWIHPVDTPEIIYSAGDSQQSAIVRVDEKIDNHKPYNHIFSGSVVRSTPMGGVRRERRYPAFPTQRDHSHLMQFGQHLEKHRLGDIALRARVAAQLFRQFKGSRRRHTRPVSSVVV